MGQVHLLPLTSHYSPRKGPQEQEMQWASRKARVLGLYIPHVRPRRNWQQEVLLPLSDECK